MLVEGRRRCRIARFATNEEYFAVEAEDIVEDREESPEQEALQRTVRRCSTAMRKLSKRLQPDVLASIRAIEEYSGRLADTIIAHLPIKHPDKQHMLEMSSPAGAPGEALRADAGEIEILQVERKIRTRVKKQMERTEKEYYLNEQMRAIQKELGDRGRVQE